MNVNIWVFISICVIAIAAVVFCVLYFINYKTWPWAGNPVEDYMLAQAKNTSLDPNTRNVLAEASKWVRVFETLKNHDYVYTTNGKKYDMTVFRTATTADQNDSAKTPYLVVTKFLKRNFEGDVQESATPSTSRKDNSNVSINVGGCEALDEQKKEYKCPSAIISNGPDTAENTIEMFTTCGGY